MATASTLHFSPTSETTPAFYIPGVNSDQAVKTSELLQENHDKHHIFFDKSGFHNHIAHHLCTLYALNAPSTIIQKQYDTNKTYQRPPVPLSRDVVKDLHDPARFKQFLGKEDYYHDYLEFFQQEMSQNGWQDTVNKYLFARDDRADDMLVRLYAGFLHPIIHLGFGIEFQQPAIIAEALAQTAVHANWMAPILLGAEQEAATSSSPSKSIVDLLAECRAHPALRDAAASTTNNRIRDGILSRCPDLMVSIASQYKLDRPPTASALRLKAAEMTNAAAYFTGAAQRRTKAIKMDFYYMHSLNSSVFFSSFLAQDWIKNEDKARLLEWKVRTDITLYASRGSPELFLDEIEKYKPKKPSSWEGIFKRVCEFEDDGHGAKLVRALAHGQRICREYEHRDEFKVKGDMWLQLGHMGIDSVEAEDGIHWVRSCGFDEAWKDVPDRARAQL